MSYNYVSVCVCMCVCVCVCVCVLCVCVRVCSHIHRASLLAQMVKNLTAMWETRVQSLSQEDPLEKDMATPSSIPAWRIPWTEESGGLQSIGSQRVGDN